MRVRAQIETFDYATEGAILNFRRRASKRPFLRNVSVVSVLVACAAAAVLILRLAASMRPGTSVMLHLVDASGTLPHRPFKSRLSGEFPYKPLAETQRGERPVSPEYWSVYAAAAVAQREAVEDPDAVNLHALGVAELLTGAVQKAVSTLERALINEAGTRNLALAVARANSAPLLNNLCSAYLARAEQGFHSDYLRALPLAERAWKIGRTPPAAWNRALVFEALGLNRESASAWDDLLSVESSAEWRAEALQHRRNVTSPTMAALWSREQEEFHAAVRAADAVRLERYARQYSSQVAHLGFQHLNEWAAQADAQPEAPAHAALGAARLIATALAPQDPFLRDAVQTIDDAIAAQNPNRRAVLVNGMRTLNAAKQAYDRRDTDQALKLARDAARTLENAGSCVSLTARTLAASCLVFAQHYDAAAEEIAHNTAHPVARHRYPGVYARSEWIAGLCFLAAGRPYEALQAYAKAKEILNAAGDRGAVAGLEDLEGEAYEHLGLYEESWRHRRQGLLAKAAAGDHARIEAVFGGAARAALSLGELGAAVRILDSAIPLKHDDAFASAELLVLRGAIRQRLGAEAEAESDLRGARTALSKLPAGGTRDAVAADIRAVELLAGAPSGAPDGSTIDSAIAEAQRRNNKFRLIPLLRTRAAAVTNEAADNRDGAERDLQAALDEMQAQLATIHDTEVRLMAQRSLHDLYSSRVRMMFERGDYHGALRLLNCERERNQIRRNGGVCGDINPGSIPDAVTVLDYAVAGDAVYAFGLGKHTLRAVRVPVSSATLESRVREWVAAIHQDDAARTREIGAGLYADLVEPLLAESPASDTLVVAGSPTRSMLPFAALWSRSTGRYLVEDRTIIYAPGLSHLMVAAGRDATLKRQRTGDYDVFSIAPAYAVETPPYLSPLPATATEARAIGALYGRRAGKAGTPATSMSFKELADRATIVHFAGHSIINNERPRYSALAFGSDTRTLAPDMLYAHDIAELNYSRTRLVVLASCSSALSADATVAAPASLAGAFLEAGVPGVVATFWPIDDGDAATPLLMFHRSVAAGGAAPVALRQMQIAALRSGDSHLARVRTWAPYAFTGWHSGQ